MFSGIWVLIDAIAAKAEISTISVKIKLNKSKFLIDKRFYRITIVTEQYYRNVQSSSCNSRDFYVFLSIVCP